MVVAVLGGTGNLGYALARRWALAGQAVVIGSRSAESAAAAAAEIRAEAESHGMKVDIEGRDNAEAAGLAEVVVLTVPFASQRAVLETVREAVQGKVVVDTTVPLVPPKVMRVQLPPEGSAAQAAAAILGEGVRVVSAFHSVPAATLRTDAQVDCDVLVFGDDKEARQVCVDLAQAADLKAFHAGALVNSVSAEALTSVLIFLNKHYGGHAGVRFTGLEHG